MDTFLKAQDIANITGDLISIRMVVNQRAAILVSATTPKKFRSVKSMNNIFVGAVFAIKIFTRLP